MSAVANLREAALARPSVSRLVSRHGWTVGVIVLFLVLFALDAATVATFDGFAIQTIFSGSTYYALVAMAQAVIVISGGIDLSIGAVMVLANIVSAKAMEGHGFAACVGVAVLVIAGTAALQWCIGWVITTSKVPDIVITLAASFVVTGFGLLLLSTPGGGTAPGFQKIINGNDTGEQWWPSVLFLAAVYALVWLPIRRRRLGLSFYAVGSSKNATFLSGIDVVKPRRRAYFVAGILVGIGGVAITANVGAADARETLGGLYTLSSVGAVVLGGVALTGGVGGLIGPLFAAFCTQLIQTILINKGVDQNWADVLRNVLIIMVVAFGGLVQSRRRRPT